MRDSEQRNDMASPEIYLALPRSVHKNIFTTSDFGVRLNLMKSGFLREPLTSCQGGHAIFPTGNSPFTEMTAPLCQRRS
jgi:hypothetical protein